MQESPSPTKDRKHYHHPSKRGSTTSPGPAALSSASDWLAVLTPVMIWATFPASGLALVGNLVELLFYHSPREHRTLHSSGDEPSQDLANNAGHAFSLPPGVQVIPVADLPEDLVKLLSPSSNSESYQSTFIPNATFNTNATFIPNAT